MVDGKKEYIITLKLLNIEIFSLGISTTSDSTKWVGIGVGICILILAFVMLFGQDLLRLFNVSS